MTLVLLFVILGALVFVHELGHFISAKRAGIRVDEFALGFPPRLFSRQIGETRYSLNLIPFGGFVKIFGEDAGANGSGGPDDTRRFVQKSRLVQALVLASGVLGNLVFAWLLLSLTFLYGVPYSPGGHYDSEVKDPKVVVTSVLAESPAERAGLREGDAILSLVSGDRELSSIDTLAVSRFIGGAPSEVALTISRHGETQLLSLLPVAGVVEGRKGIGVTLDTIGVVRFGIFRSLYEGFLMTADITREIVAGLAHLVGQAFLGRADLGAITGPVGIAGLIGEARLLGLAYLLSFTAFISINLAVINLLPVPALDGGRLLFLAIEGARRRPIPPRLTRLINTAGFSLLLLLMALITYRDIVKLL